MSETPTIEQLGRFMSVRVHGPAGIAKHHVEAATNLLRMSPRLEEMARARHAEFQEAVSKGGSR